MRSCNIPRAIFQVLQLGINFPKTTQRQLKVARNADYVADFIFDAKSDVSCSNQHAIPPNTATQLNNDTTNGIERPGQTKTPHPSHPDQPGSNRPKHAPTKTQQNADYTKMKTSSRPWQTPPYHCLTPARGTQQGSRQACLRRRGYRDGGSARRRWRRSAACAADAAKVRVVWRRRRWRRSVPAQGGGGARRGRGKRWRSRLGWTW